MNFTVKHFSELTTAELYEILKARSQVFIVELGMNCQDMDGVDLVSKHYFLEEKGRIMAYLRAYPAEQNSTLRIGRVLTIEHGVGLGKMLMEQTVTDIKKAGEFKRICLDSQKHAIGFYEKLGFCIVSGEFLEEGVVHVAMQLDLL